MSLSLNHVFKIRPISQEINSCKKKTSLLRKLQAQTLADKAPPMGIIHPLSKIAVTFALWDLESPKK